MRGAAWLTCIRFCTHIVLVPGGATCRRSSRLRWTKRSTMAFVAGPRQISRFIEELVRPHVVEPDLPAAYAEMAAQESREADAEEWSDALLPGVEDEAR